MNQAVAMPEMRRLHLSPTLSGYLARQFASRLLALFLGLSGVVLLTTLVDTYHRLAGKDEVTLLVVLHLSLLRLPYLGQEVAPFTVLIAAMATFWRLTRHHELVVARAAGVSVWQFLLPVLVVALLTGVFTVTVMNPVASVLLGRYTQLEAQLKHNKSNLLSISSSGLWLRQADPGGQTVIHALRVSEGSMTLQDVIVFRLTDDDRFISRIDAARAELHDGYWRFYEAWLSRPGEASRFEQQFDIATDLSSTKIQDSFASPRTISFWSLPDSIEMLEQAGFSALRHKLQWHRLLAMPMLFSAMVLLAATFSLRPHRRGKVGILILSGVIAGFLLYLMSRFVFALGLSEKIPVILSGWAPAGIGMMLGIALLFHLEDG